MFARTAFRVIDCSRPDTIALVADLLKALGNRDRLRLSLTLLHEELCVSELERRLDLRQSTLSQQLTVLRRHGLVITRRDGKRIFYRMDSGLAAKLLSALKAAD